MSLINDALKKVSQAERGKPQVQPVDFEMRAMQPVYEKRPPHLLWISIALLAGVIGVATFVFAKQHQTRIVATAPPVAPQSIAEPTKALPTEVKIASTPAPVESAKAPVVEIAAPAAPTAPISPATPAPAVPVALTPAQPAPVIAPASASPAFRLKGILYTKNPTALINEASVHVGGEVDGATVTKIEATTVALDYEGKTITLKLAAK
jgi:cytoskeletal protein RodZ